MNHLNSILFEGIVSSEPEVKVYGKGEESLVTFVLSNHRYYQKSDNDEGTLREQVTSIPVKAWKKLGNQCINAIHKGITVRVVGRIEVFEYTTENKLKTFSRTAIVANHIEYRSSKEYEDTNILDC